MLTPTGRLCEGRCVNISGMQIRKAVITAAGRDQRNLPMQTLFDERGTERSVLNLVVREAVRAGVGDICIVVWPGDEEPYSRLLADVGARLTFVEQTEARGYAHAVFCARSRFYTLSATTFMWDPR